MTEAPSVDDIARCRRSSNNDIDLEAVFGGRINGRKQKDLKVNPVYTDRSRSNSESGNDENSTDTSERRTSICVITYESIPQDITIDTPVRDQEPEAEVCISDGYGKVTTDTILGQLNAAFEDEEEGENGIDQDARYVNTTLTYGVHRVKHENTNEIVETRIHLITDDDEQIGNFLNSSEKSTNNGLDVPNQSKSVNKLSHTESSAVQTEEDNGSNHSNQGETTDGVHVDKEIKQLDGDAVVRHGSDVNNSAEAVDDDDVTMISNNDNRHTENNNYVSRSALLAQVIEKAQARNCTESKESVEDKFADISSMRTNVLAPKPKPRNFGLLGYNNNAFTDDDSEKVSDCFRKEIDTDELKQAKVKFGMLKHETETNEEMAQLNQTTVITEASVHVSVNEDSLDVRVNINDWPDIDDIVRAVPNSTIEIHNDPEVREKTVTDQHNNVEVTSPMEVISNNEILQEVHVEPSADKLQLPDEVSSPKNNSTSQSGSIVDGASSTRTLKSILSNGSVPDSLGNEQARPDLGPEIHESKTVKFSDDTVFNENKQRKYRVETVEKINLREFYRGKISSDNAVAKVNPLFSDEEEDRVSLTDDEKLAYQSVVAAKHGSVGRLNKQAYMEHYLILKAHGLKPSKPFDINQLPEEMEVPTYDRLIRRTLAKERRRLILKWSFVILTVAIITAVATTVGVYYTLGF